MIRSRARDAALEGGVALRSAGQIAALELNGNWGAALAAW